MILFFTDGAYEARNHEGVAFGIDRMHETLERLLYHSKDEILDGVMKAILDFIGDEPLSDDICLVAIEVTDKTEPA